jgi:hypothetical protein
VIWYLIGAAVVVLWFAYDVWSMFRETPTLTGWIAGGIASFIFGNTTGPRAEPPPAPAPPPYGRRIV